MASKNKAKDGKSLPDRFSIDQQFLIVQWLAEGLTTKEMNQRAAVVKPPFTISAQEAYYYRVTREIDVEEARKARSSEALNSGFAVKENRIAAMNELATKIFEELLGEGGKLWLQNVKGIGSGPDYERVEYEEFNRSGVEALRGLMDDIATEVNQRIRRTDVTTKDKPIQGSGLDPKLWKDLSDDDLEVLEQAAEILERSASKSSSSTR